MELAHLARIGFNSLCDRLFGVGDLVERGPHSGEALEWLEHRFAAVDRHWSGVATRAYASVLDRETLQWQGFKVWGESLEGLPFTAHPKAEPDGTLWAFGYGNLCRTNCAPSRRSMSKGFRYLTSTVLHTSGILILFLEFPGIS